MRRIRLCPAIIAVVALAAPAAASARIIVHVHAHGHHPKAGKKWPVRVRVRTPSGGHPSGRLHYQFAYHGQVVASRPGVRVHHGLARDKLKFPGHAIGYPIVVRFVVDTHRGHAVVPYRVKVRR